MAKNYYCAGSKAESSSLRGGGGGVTMVQVQQAAAVTPLDFVVEEISTLKFQIFLLPVPVW